MSSFDFISTDRQRCSLLDSTPLPIRIVQALMRGVPEDDEHCCAVPPTAVGANCLSEHEADYLGYRPSAVLT